MFVLKLDLHFPSIRYARLIQARYHRSLSPNCRASDKTNKVYRELENNNIYERDHLIHSRVESLTIFIFILICEEMKKYHKSTV